MLGGQRRGPAEQRTGAAPTAPQRASASAGHAAGLDVQPLRGVGGEAVPAEQVDHVAGVERGYVEPVQAGEVDAGARRRDRRWRRRPTRPPSRRRA